MVRLLLCGVVLLGGCQTASPQHSVGELSIVTATSTQNVRLVKPLAIQGKPRLVLIFCGTGESAAQMAVNSQLDSLADSGEFVLLYLEPAHNGTWGTPNTLGEFSNPDDLALIESVLNQRASLFPEASGKVIIIGMSSGGEFALAAAARNSEHIEAVITHSSRRPLDSMSAKHKFRLLAIAGTADEQVPFEAVSQAADWYCSHGHPVQLVSIPGAGHGWQTRANPHIVRFLSEATSSP